MNWAQEYADLFDRTESDRATLALLREGLRQVAEGDYPADACNAETWAREVLNDPRAVRWQEDEDG